MTTLNTSALQAFKFNWPNDQIGERSSSRYSTRGAINILATSKLQLRDYYSLEGTLVTNGKDRQCISRFANDNNFVYDMSTQNVDVSDGAAWSTSQYGGMLAHLVKGNMHGFDLTMSIFYKPTGGYTRLGEKTIIAVSKIGVVRIKLNKLFPQLVLDSNKNDFGTMSTIPVSFKSMQRISLEGDFDKYFDFYAPRGLNVNALTVLSPNFMQIIMESSAHFDVEFFADELILTTTKPLYTVSVMTALDRALSEELKYVSRLERSWNYVPMTPPFDTLRTNFVSGKVMKIGALRFPTGLLLTAGLLGILVVVLLYAYLASILFR